MTLLVTGDGGISSRRATCCCAQPEAGASASTREANQQPFLLTVIPVVLPGKHQAGRSLHPGKVPRRRRLYTWFPFAAAMQEGGDLLGHPEDKSLLPFDQPARKQHCIRVEEIEYIGDTLGQVMSEGVIRAHRGRRARSRLLVNVQSQGGVIERLRN